jgi:N-acetylgalactosamine-6-sulfatase
MILSHTLRTDAIKILFLHVVQIWFTTDNGPEINCKPDGICERADSDPQRPKEAPGSAGRLRGRKRDIFEGGHRVPGIVSYPPVIRQENAISWETVTTMDFLPTVMELLDVDRPPEQQSWAMDGRSILSLLENATGFRWEDTEDGPRSLGLGNHDPTINMDHGYGYRYGNWKYVEGSVSCTAPSCRKAMLFDLEADLGERHDLSEVHPDVLEDLQNKFLDWHASVMKSRREESKCRNTKEVALPESLQRVTKD